MNYTLYFTLLGLLWFSIWFFGVWYFETRRTHGPLFRRLSVKRRMLLIAALVLIPCIYCLSYAPLRPSLALLMICTCRCNGCLTIRFCESHCSNGLTFGVLLPNSLWQSPLRG